MVKKDEIEKLKFEIEKERFYLQIDHNEFLNFIIGMATIGIGTLQLYLVLIDKLSFCLTSIFFIIFLLYFFIFISKRICSFKNKFKCHNCKLRGKELELENLYKK